jgi:hypothetical protein
MRTPSVRINGAMTRTIVIWSYRDALYGDHALIHNLPWRGDAGYYLPCIDALEGVRQLRAAAKDHDDRLDDYRARSRRVFDAVDPFSRHNLGIYADRLDTFVMTRD